MTNIIILNQNVLENKFHHYLVKYNVNHGGPTRDTRERSRDMCGHAPPFYKKVNNHV